MKKERPEIVIIADYMMINGELVEIDPLKTDIPDRCKLIMAELLTGNKYEYAKE